MKYKEYKPAWRTGVNERNSFRTLFRWGDQAYINEPSELFYQYLKEKLELTDEDFMIQSYDGDKQINIEIPTRLSRETIKEFADIVGKVNATTDTMSRINATYAKGMYDSMRLRREIVENVPDIVLSPSSEEQVAMILKYCNRNNIPIYVSGGNTNMVGASECEKGGVRLDFKRNFNKVISFNEIDQTVTVMPGITGPQLEDILNNANEYFTNVTGRYTVGHIPDSYEFSTVGGWVACRGVGQASMRYGGIDDILVSAKYLTPKGEIVTANCHRGTGMPSIDELMLGAEGQFGLLVSCTLKVRRYTYENKKFFSYVLKDWDTAIRCIKELAQREAGLPSVLRLCDPDSTEILIRMSKFVSSSFVDSTMERFGNVKGNRCMMIGYTEGEKSYSGYVKRSIYRHAMRYGAYTAVNGLGKKWEKTRFNNAYLRDVLQDYDILMDQIVCYVSWTTLQEAYPIIKDFFNERGVLNMTELYDITPHGVMMSVSYISKFADIDAYTQFYNEVLDMLLLAGVSAPHSHGVGREGKAVLDSMSDAYLSTLRAVKKHLDPKGIINPTGYLNESKRSKKS